MATNACLSPDFWNLNMMVMVSAKVSLAAEYSRRRPLMKKQRFRIQSVFVRRFSSGMFV